MKLPQTIYSFPHADLFLSALYFFSSLVFVNIIQAYNGILSQSDSRIASITPYYNTDNCGFPAQKPKASLTEEQALGLPLCMMKRPNSDLPCDFTTSFFFSFPVFKWLHALWERFFSLSTLYNNESHKVRRIY